jgi:aminoglycoside phosphotransferase (APT) family kinase protein
MTTGTTIDPEIINVERLQKFLDDKLPGQGQPLEIHQVPGGATNLLFKLSRAGQQWALRRPPKVKISPTAHNMMRESRVLGALADTNVPHPKLAVACDDKSIIGDDFYVMEWIDGFSPRDPLPPPFDKDTKARAGLGFQLVDGIAKLASVDWQAKGLQDFGRPEGFLQRQTSRWLGQLEQYKTREIPGIDRVAKWLNENIPPMSTPGIFHGDYQFVNVLFYHGAPAKLAAIVDWDMATIGDPLVDLGWVLGGWPDPGEENVWTNYLTQREGLPPRAELAEYYARHTGRDVTHIKYYIVLALFKIAVLMEGHYNRAVKTNDAPRRSSLEITVPRYIRRAEEIIAREA